VVSVITVLLRFRLSEIFLWHEFCVCCLTNILFGDIFLKFSIWIYLSCIRLEWSVFCASLWLIIVIMKQCCWYVLDQVSNYNLYCLGKRKHLPECMVAVKFEPSENWLPPGYTLKTGDSTRVTGQSVKPVKSDASQKESHPIIHLPELATQCTSAEQRRFKSELEELSRAVQEEDEASESSAMAEHCLLMAPYNLQTQHSLPDKSIADCVEALIGCYLASCGSRTALQFMDWLGLHVLPAGPTDNSSEDVNHVGRCSVEGPGCLPAPSSPLLRYVENADGLLQFHLSGYDAFEAHIQYKFRDRSYLLQAFTHASYHYNEITDCYQRYVLCCIFVYWFAVVMCFKIYKYTVIVMFSFITLDSIYAIARICHASSVCLSVRLSVTRVYCIKTTERIIEILSPSDRPIILVFRHQG